MFRRLLPVLGLLLFAVLSSQAQNRMELFGVRSRIISDGCLLLKLHLGRELRGARKMANYSDEALICL